MVVTSRSATSDTAVMQERAASLSTITVQAPHSAWPQPYFEPVNPSSSRRYHSRDRLGSPSQVCSCPLIFTLIMIALALWDQWASVLIWWTRAGPHVLQCARRFNWELSESSS